MPCLTFSWRKSHDNMPSSPFCEYLFLAYLRNRGGVFVLMVKRRNGAVARVGEDKILLFVALDKDKLVLGREGCAFYNPHACVLVGNGVFLPRQVVVATLSPDGIDEDGGTCEDEQKDNRGGEDGVEVGAHDFLTFFSVF